MSLDGWRHVTFIDDGLGALTALRGVASLNLQGCATLTDKGLEAIAHMTSLTSVNLQDCRQISGACFLGLLNLFRVHNHVRGCGILHIFRSSGHSCVWGCPSLRLTIGGFLHNPKMHCICYCFCLCLASLQEPVLRSMRSRCKRDVLK